MHADTAAGLQVRLAEVTVWQLIVWQEQQHMKPATASS
jgi:hypothetical protein